MQKIDHGCKDIQKTNRVYFLPVARARILPKTYLLIKFRPNNIEYMEKQDEISNYKRELTIKKNKLLDCRERNPQIDNILKEWQPNNLIDELAIVDAFEAYTHFNVWRVVNKKGYKNKNYTLDSVNQYF